MKKVSQCCRKRPLWRFRDDLVLTSNAARRESGSTSVRRTSATHRSHADQAWRNAARRKKARDPIAERMTLLGTPGGSPILYVSPGRDTAPSTRARRSSWTHTQIKGGSQSGTVEVAESIMALWIQKGSLSNCYTSEEKLQADLNLSRSGGSTDPSEACVAGVCGRIVQIHIVESVEKLEAKLQGFAFRD